MAISEMWVAFWRTVSWVGEQTGFAAGCDSFLDGVYPDDCRYMKDPRSRMPPPLSLGYRPMRRLPGLVRLIGAINSVTVSRWGDFWGLFPEQRLGDEHRRRGITGGRDWRSTMG